MLFKRVTIFHCLGFKVKADASWLFLSLLIAWTLSTKQFPVMFPGHEQSAYQWMGFATLVGIFVSILAHELAHSVIAEYYDMKIISITLFIFGGVAEMKGDPKHPKGEFLMAMAGPTMSLLMSVFFYAWAELSGMVIGVGMSSEVLGYLGKLNMLIALFNVVPAFPLDGGRALRAIIWRIKGNLVVATRISSEMGSLFAYILLSYACYRIVYFDDTVAGMWWGILGYFVYSSGHYALRQTENRSLLGSEKVARFLNDQVITVTPDMTIHDFVENYVYKHYQRSFPVIDHGKLAGVITLKSILSLERHKWHWLHVASVMEGLSDRNVVRPDFSAADAFDLLQRHREELLMVANDDGQFLGICSVRDLAAYLSITMKIDHNKPVMTSRGL